VPRAPKDHLDHQRGEVDALLGQTIDLAPSISGVGGGCDDSTGLEAREPIGEDVRRVPSSEWRIPYIESIRVYEIRST
jgi:hypothetical protein